MVNLRRSMNQLSRGGSLRFLHKLWKNPLLLLGYSWPREVWWASRWLLVSILLKAVTQLWMPDAKISVMQGLRLVFCFGFCILLYFIY
ncbi:hypothetical protein Leryth_001577 [Lithospermum erythrorhizon]|nr:hypothetical protein Leryth_001577 [Lithospermum erythrorhizon]